MEQGNRSRAHLERVLFVAGMQNAGKSTLLRRMFVDPRLGGVVPTEARLRLVSLSQERCLFVRITSPHERDETITKFFKKLDNEMTRAWRTYWRFNLACAVQPLATRTTPDLVTICRELKERLIPERIRIVQIHPRQDGENGVLLTSTDVDQLRRLNVEVMTIDGRRSADSHIANGFLLSDYFDFT